MLRDDSIILVITEVYFKKMIFLEVTPVTFRKLFFKINFKNLNRLPTEFLWNVKIFFLQQPNLFGGKEGKTFNGNAI